MSLTDDVEHRQALDQRVTELFRAHASFVWRSVIRLGVSPTHAEDAVQDVFLVVNRKVAEYDERGLTKAWLFAIARRVASHHHRASAREAQRVEQVRLEPPANDPEDMVARSEAVAMVARFLEQLDEPRRMVFYLADIEGLTAPEISAALGVKLNTVYSRLRAARQRFERLLSSAGERTNGHAAPK